MYRPWMSLFPCLFSMLLIAAPPALAQPPVLEDEMVGPDLGIKEFAKARFEAEQATLHDLAKARRDALKVCFQIRKNLYAEINVPVTLNLVLETWAELVNAELAFSDKPDDQLAIQASHWLFTWATERITAAMACVGRVSRAAHLQATALAWPTRSN